MIGHKFARNFVIENEATQETKIIYKFLIAANGVVDLLPVLEELGSPYGKIYKIYSCQDACYRLLSDYCSNWSHPFVFPAYLFEPEIILIKYQIDQAETESIHSGTAKSDTSSVKKERSKERSIAEVIEIVKYWRELHLNHLRAKKMNLQEAAEIVGISKKSLDDYYYQLRLGEKFGFDFKKHLYEKVGTLRNFIKEVKKKNRNDKTKMEKHPKNLKIIEEYAHLSCRSTAAHSAGKPELRALSKMEEEPIDDEKSMQSIEDQFYNDFEFFEEPIDPFLNFEGNFHKKDEKELHAKLFF